MIKSFLLLPYTIFVYPIKSLYFMGPSISGWGGWGGINAVDICSQLTQVPSSHWLKNMEGCNDLLERKFSSFLILLACSFYVWMLYKFLCNVCYRYFIINPFITELKTILTPLASSIEKEKVNQFALVTNYDENSKVAKDKFLLQ